MRRHVDANIVPDVIFETSLGFTVTQHVPLGFSKLSNALHFEVLGKRGIGTVIVGHVRKICVRVGDLDTSIASAFRKVLPSIMERISVTHKNDLLITSAERVFYISVKHHKITVLPSKEGHCMIATHGTLVLNPIDTPVGCVL